MFDLEDDPFIIVKFPSAFGSDPIPFSLADARIITQMEAPTSSKDCTRRVLCEDKFMAIRVGPEYFTYSRRKTQHGNLIAGEAHVDFATLKTELKDAINELVWLDPDEENKSVEITIQAVTF